MDVIIIRENEEDTYAGIEHQQTDEVFQCLKLVSRPGSERICRYAFEYAAAHGRKKVTCFTKDNIMNDIVFQYEAEAQSRVEGMQRLALVITGLTISLLLLCAVFIFEPVIRRVRKTTAAHNAQLEAIDRSQGRIEFSTDGVIQDVNKQYLQYLDYSRDELIGQPECSLLPEDINPVEFDTQWMKLRVGHFYLGDVRRKTKTGAVCHLQTSYNPVLGEDGSVEKIVCYASNVTGQKEAEVELHLAMINLQKQSQRARDLAREAESANEAKSMQCVILLIHNRRN